MSHNRESDANDPMATWMRQLSDDPVEHSHRPLVTVTILSFPIGSED